MRAHNRLAVVVGCVCALAGPGAPGQWAQIRKLNPDDAAAFDWFAFSVSIDGGVAMAGSHLDDDADHDSGSAYLFDVATGEQLNKLTADDATAGDQLGFSVSISGDIAMAGSTGDDDDGISSGSAYLFDVTKGEQLHKLTADDAAAGDQFGFAVSISGDVAIVGSIGDDDAGDDTGSAYLFDVTTGQQLFKLTADDAGAGDQFGWAVSISGDVAIVGSIGDDDAGANSGAAYLFDVTTGQQLHKLTADDAAEGDQLGWSVSTSGDVALAGALNDDDAGSNSGSAYLFDAKTGKQIQKLTPDDGDIADLFGYSVSIDGGVAVIGAYLDDDVGNASGSAYVFETDLPCPADLDEDGSVGIGDLLALFGLWGPCPGPPGCPGDLNGDGVVGVADMLIMFANWGDCP